jgi:hypothetical protein
MSILGHDMFFTPDRIEDNGTMKSIGALIRDNT